MYFSMRLSRGVITAAAAVLLTAVCAGVLLSSSLARARETSASAAAPRKTVYLTFDDGPSGNTPAVLAALERNGVRATFFVTAQRPDDLGLLADEADAGHLVALHSYSHDFHNIYSGEGAFWEDIERLQAVIEAQTGARASVLRFPGGSSNTIAGRSLMRSLTDGCAERGYAYFDWNVDTRDAVGSTKSAGFIAERAIKGALAEQTPVILMHDGPMNTTAADAIDIIVPALLAEGCAFATLDELGVPVHHSLA